MPVKTTLRENIAIALQSIAGNRLRTSLTALIIAIGIMALVGILTAIEGIKQYTSDAFASLGANSFTIQNRGSGLGFGNGGHRKIYPSIRYDEAVRFKEKYKLPATVSIDLPVSGTSVAKYGDQKTNPNISLTGGNENYIATNGYKIAYGRNFTQTELNSGADVVIIGDELRAKLFKKADPINKAIYIGSNRFNIIGVFEAKGNAAGLGGDRFCLIPIYKAKQIDTLKNPTFSITVMIHDGNALEASIGE